MRTKFTFAISLLMATVLVLGALFTSCAPKKEESQVVEYLDKIFETTFAGVEIAEPQVTTSKLTFNNTPDLGIPHFVGAEMTLITGTSGESAAQAEVTLDSGKVDLSVYNTGSACIIGSSAIGATKYGLEISDAGTLVNLLGSMFLPTQPGYGDDDAAIQEGTSVSGLLGSLSGINSLIDGNNPEKVYSLLEKYAKIVANAAESTCESKLETGETINVTLEFNTDSAKKLIKDVFASLKKDNDLKDIVESILVSGGMSEDEAKAQLSAIFSDETVQSVYDALDSAPFTLKVKVSASKDYILNGVSVELKSQGVTYKVFVNAESESKLELGLATSVSMDGFSYKQENKLVFENKTADGAEVFEIELVTTTDGETQTECLFKSEIKDGKYSVTVLVPDETEGSYSMTLNGETKTEGNKTTTTLTSVTAFGNTLKVDLKVETETGGTLPEFPTDFKNILDVSGDEFKEIANNIKNSPIGQFIPEAHFGAEDSGEEY